MDNSIILFRVLGTFLVILSSLWLFRRVSIFPLMVEIIESRALFAITGLIALIVGLTIIYLNPVYEVSPNGLITLFGYFACLNGILRLGFPDTARGWSLYTLNNAYWGFSFFIMALGLFFLGRGFL